MMIAERRIMNVERPESHSLLVAGRKSGLLKGLAKGRERE